MARAGGAIVFRSPAVDFAGVTAAVVVLVILGVLLGWPLLNVVLDGLLAGPSLWPVVGITLVVAGVATAGSLGMAAIVVVAVRLSGAGRQWLAGIHRAGVFVPPFVVPLALLVLVGRERLSHALGGVATLALIALAQAFVFLPHAVALVMRALASVTAEAEQAAELLGASRWTVLRRVTLGLARAELVTAALSVFGLCLADAVSPVLVGFLGPAPAPAGVVMLAGFIVAEGHWNTPLAAGGAVALMAFTVAVSLAGRTWRSAGVPLAQPATPAAGVRPAAAVRAGFTACAWLITAALAALWAAVPMASVLALRGGPRISLEHWLGVLGAARPLVNSLVLGASVALVGTALALGVVSLATRRRPLAAVAMSLLARVPVAVPAVVGALAYMLAYSAPGGGFIFVVLLVAAWELPVMLRAGANVLARADRAQEQAALTLGARSLTTLRRVVAPALRPAVVWLLCHGFAAGLTAFGSVVVFAFAERGDLRLGVIHMLASASTGSVGAACAVATVLLALAGGATLLGRAVAGRESIPTLLA
jgi:iron(III) transport system permease protein